jgi:hypothetical protein
MNNDVPVLIAQTLGEPMCGAISKVEARRVPAELWQIGFGGFAHGFIVEQIRRWPSQIAGWEADLMDRRFRRNQLPDSEQSACRAWQ